MRKPKLLLVFAMLSMAVFSDIAAGVFSDDFDDGDISDWTVGTNGFGVFAVSNEKYVSSPFSVEMNSPGDSQAMGESPIYDVNLLENYHISFSFLVPHTANHWFEVFNNHQVYLVIDSGTELKCYLGNFQSRMIKTLNTNQWYLIEIKVHPFSEDYDVYIDGQLEETCDMWIHGGFEDSFRIGDREDGENDYGRAHWDDITITQPVDSDGDGIMDPDDNCPYDYNPNQEDRNSDGWGDICECRAANIDNDSGHVDLGDFALLAFNWRDSDPTVPGDINDDGVVDFNDLEILAYHWLSDCN